MLNKRTAALIVMLECLTVLPGAPSLAASEPEYPETLSGWQLFESDGEWLTLSEDYRAYSVHPPLFTDGAAKLRAIKTPHPSLTTDSQGHRFVFPVGTVITKTFYYPIATRGDSRSRHQLRIKDPEAAERFPFRVKKRDIVLVETRFLIREAKGWVPLVYVWDEEQTEAVLNPYGDAVPLTVLEGGGQPAAIDYQVPDRHQCAECHESRGQGLSILGLKPLLFDTPVFWQGVRVSQPAHWQARGWLKATSQPQKPLYADARENQARKYLDSNCAHCHNPQGAAGYVGLDWRYENTRPDTLGVCKELTASGSGSRRATVDIDPGHPEKSALVTRMQSRDPAVRMPELGRSLVDEYGWAVISQWVSQLQPEASCSFRK